MHRPLRGVLLLLALSYYLWSSTFVFGPSRATSPKPRRGKVVSSITRRARGGEGESPAVGDAVTALYPDDEQWYPGVIEKSNEDGSYTVKWDDPEGGPESHDVTGENIKKIVIFKDYKVGERVEAVFPDDGYWYPGEVTKVNDGSFTVKWDDPDGGPEESDVVPKDMKYPPIPFSEIEIGKKYTGTVKSVLDFGAFVDIGAESDGLLHISRISNERIENIYDYLSEGQEVEVWCSGKREEEGKYGLTMVEGKMDSIGGRRAPADLTPFADLPSDQWFDGVVARTAPFGAFVTVKLEDGSEADGLVHVSKIKDGFVDNVDDEVSAGQEVKVRIESVDLDSNRMSLSMREGFGGGFREPADLRAFEDVPSDTWLKGKVVRIAPFGAFVSVTAPDGAEADGLVHVTAIRDGFVESVEDEVSVGQEVEVRVESVNVDDGKMSLSMKPAEY